MKCLSALLTFACYYPQLPGSEPRDLYVTDEMFLFVRERAQKMVGYAMDIAYITGMDEGTIRTLKRKNLTEET